MRPPRGRTPPERAHLYVVFWVGKGGVVSVPHALSRDAVYRKDGGMDHRCRAYRRIKKWAEKKVEN